MEKTFFELPNLAKIMVSGADCERYLNNRLSSNVKQLSSIPSMQFGAALSAQGRTEGLYAVIKLSKDLYLLCAETEDHNSLLKALSRYKVADRVSFELLDSDYCAFHISNRQEHIFAEIKSKFNFKVIAYGINRIGCQGLDLIINCETSKAKDLLKASGLDELPVIQSKMNRFIARIPKFPDEINEQLLLQESGLAGTYSTNKGCYVGQEVTQKIDSFARLPYRLAYIRTANNQLADFSPEQTIYSDSAEKTKAGEIISFCEDSVSKSTMAFARIKNQTPDLDIIFSAGLECTVHEIHDFSSEEKTCYYQE